MEASRKPGGGGRGTKRGGLAFATTAISVTGKPALGSGAVRALGPAAAPRVLVVTPEVGRTPIEFYAPQTVRLQRAGAPVTEIAVVANARPPRFVPRPPPPGFRLASTRRAASWEVVRYMSSTARPIGPNRARAVRLDLQAAAATLIQRGGG